MSDRVTVLDEETVFGAVLAGGEGRRFSEGRPGAKPGARVGGVSMAARAVRALEPNVSSVGIVGPAGAAESVDPSRSSSDRDRSTSDRSRFTSDAAFLRRIGVQGVPLRRDEAPGRGPLEGLRIALRWASALGADRVAVLPCDLPLVDADVVGRIVHAFRTASPSRDALVPVVGARAQPLAGVYRVDALDAVERRLDGAEDRSLHALLAELDVERVDVEALGVDPDRFLNVNREEDRLRAERLLARRASGSAPS